MLSGTGRQIKCGESHRRVPKGGESGNDCAASSGLPIASPGTRLHSQKSTYWARSSPGAVGHCRVSMTATSLQVEVEVCWKVCHDPPSGWLCDKLRLAGSNPGQCSSSRQRPPRPHKSEFSRHRWILWRRRRILETWDNCIAPSRLLRLGRMRAHGTRRESHKPRRR